MIKNLEDFALQIRYYTLKELGRIGYGHYGGALSIVEALAVLYGKEMKYDSQNPKWEDRDYFVLSKGHAGPSYYATLALSGFFPIDKLYTLNDNNTNLPSHPDRLKVEGVDMTTGSLGQGISVAGGIAYGLKAKNKSNRVYCIVGDGELNEGQCWESFMFIGHNKLNNIVVMVDDNKKQLDGYTDDICNLYNIEEKFKAFGFESYTINGNDVNEVDKALQKAKNIIDKPVAIILDTVKGAKVSYIEGKMDNHHVRLDENGKKIMDDYLKIMEKELKQRGLLGE